MIDKLKSFIEDSQRILITSHISPDVDAICSALLMLNTLGVNFPDKTVNLVLEELPNQDLSFLNGFDQIKRQSLADAISGHSPELLIITDAAKLSRCSRNDGERAKQLVDERGVKTAVIDHHEPDDKDQTDVYINNGYPAAAQEVYHVLFDKLDLSKPEGYAQITLLGLLSDTLRFKYKNPKHRETFALASDLIDAGADIEALENRLETYTKEQLEVISHLIGNLHVADGYNYSFMSDDFADSWQTSGKNPDELKAGGTIFVNQLIRNVEPNMWGFLVYRELVPSENNYSVSFRSEGDTKDVSLLAKQLGGGGHKPSAGAKFHAQSVEEALNKVLAVVENTNVS